MFRDSFTYYVFMDRMGFSFRFISGESVEYYSRLCDIGVLCSENSISCGFPNVKQHFSGISIGNC